MAEVALLRAERHTAREETGGGLRFGNVALFGRSAVAADVTDGFRCDARLLKRHRHAAVHGGLLGASDMSAVAVAGEADDFRVDPRPARLCAGQRFQHQHPRTFADDQAVTVAVIRRGSGFRRVVFQAGGIKRVEDAYFGMAEFFAATRQHHRNQAEADGLVGVTDSLTTGGTGAGGGN